MGKYSDEDIRICKKITLQIAAEYLGISPMAVGIGMRNNLFPSKNAVSNKDTVSALVAFVCVFRFIFLSR